MLNLKKKLRIIISISICTSIIFLSSCNNNNTSSNTTQNSTKTNNTSQSSSEKSNPLNLQKITDAVSNAVNYDAFYKGQYSFFNSDKEQTYLYDIKSSPESDIIYIVFKDKLISTGFQNRGPAYYAMSILNGKRGYGYVPSKCIIETSQEELTEELGRLGYTIYKNSSLNSSSINTPSFNNTTKLDKKKISTQIMELVINNFKKNNIKGSFKYYVKDFNENDYETAIVVEDSNNKSYIYHVNLNDKWGVIPTSIDEVTSPDLTYEAAQLKKTVIYTGEFNN